MTIHEAFMRGLRMVRLPEWAPSDYVYLEHSAAGSLRAWAVIYRGLDDPEEVPVLLLEHRDDWDEVRVS